MTQVHDFAGSEPADAAVPQGGDPKTERLRKLVAQIERKRKLQTELNDANAQITALEPLVCEQFQQDGMQSVNIDGFTVYLSSTIYAGPKDGDKAGLIQALKGLDDSWSFLVQEGCQCAPIDTRESEIARIDRP